MFEIDVRDQEVRRALRRLAALTDDMRPAMADVALVLEGESERQFRSQAGPDGKWDDLTEATKAMRTKAGKWPGQMLQVSAGGLAASVQTGFDRGAAWIGSNKPYAAMHQLGGTTAATSMIPGKRIPARQYLPVDSQGALSSEAATGALEVVVRRLERAVG